MDKVGIFHDLGLAGPWLTIFVIGYGLYRIWTNQNAWTLPWEFRRRSRLKMLQDMLATEQNDGLKTVLDTQRRRLVFFESTGISTNDARREQLIELQKRSGHMLNWQSIRDAYSYLKFDKAGNLKKGVSPFYWAWMIYCFLSALAALAFAVRAINLPTPSAGNVIGFVIFQLLAVIVCLTLVVAFSRPAWPILRAIQLQPWIPEPAVPEPPEPEIVAAQPAPGGQSQT